MHARSHAGTMSFKCSSSRRRSPRFLDKCNSLPQHGENFSEKLGACGSSLDSIVKSRGHGVSKGGLRKSSRLNGKVEPDKVSDVPCRTRQQIGGGGSVGWCSSGNGRRKSIRLNGNIRPDGISDMPSGNSDREDCRRSAGHGVPRSCLRKSPRLNSNVKPDERSNIPSANSDKREQTGSPRFGISAAGARKSPRLNGGDEHSRVSGVPRTGGNCRDRGHSGGRGNLDIIARRSPRLNHCVKTLNLKDGWEMTSSRVLGNKVVNDARQLCGDAMAGTEGRNRQCVLGLPISYATNIIKEGHIQYCKRGTANNPTSDHSHEEWTQEQLGALHRAYLLAKPTPRFWKKVSKLVPGKSAKECFDKVHSEHVTPPQTRLQSRFPKTNTFMEDEHQLSASKILKSHKPLAKKPMKNKIHLPYKTVRQLMKKQSSLSRNHEADFFKTLETNSSASPKLPSTLLSTPENLLKSGGLLEKFHQECSSSSRKKPLSRFHSSTGTDLVSPPVLKQVKNMAMHEKYLDYIHKRDAKRRKLEPPGGANEVKVGQNVDVVGAAKNALMLDATDAIKQFQLAVGNDKSLCTETGGDASEINDDDEEIDMLSESHLH